MNGKIGLALIVILIASTMMVFTVKPASAQSLPTPATPEFTVRFVNDSYSIQPTATTLIDPYTGKQTVTMTPSQYIADDYVEVSIMNPAFTPFSITAQNVNGVEVNLYFNVRSKGNFSSDWTVQAQGASDFGVEMAYGSQYTIVKLYTNDVPCPALIDFEVQAEIGYLYNWFYQSPVQGSPTQWDPRVEFNGTVSDWSSPQTLAVDNSQNSSASTALPNTSFTPIPTLTPASTAAVPELSLLVIVPLLFSVLSVAVVVRHRREAVR